jgi:hypothetical protein
VYIGECQPILSGGRHRPWQEDQVNESGTRIARVIASDWVIRMMTSVGESSDSENAAKVADFAPVFSDGGSLRKSCA